MQSEMKGEWIDNQTMVREAIGVATLALENAKFGLYDENKDKYIRILDKAIEELTRAYGQVGKVKK